MALILAAAAIVAAVVVGGDDAAERPAKALSLTPKAKLPVINAVEGTHWTQAPAVPPAIERTGQARIVVEWTATEFTKNLDPANGVRYSAWGFEDAAPGPMLRARVGDLIEVRLTNDIKSTHPHNIDFHFATGPGGGAPALNVSPGKSAMVQVRALAPGVYMYHCATPDIPTHIANGMYGYVIVEPEDGLPEVDKEFYVVQSEFYAKGKNPATLDVKKLDLEEPNYVVLNGAVGSLMGDAAPKVKTGDRVRIWYGNAGPQLVSSFHVIGEIFDRVYREGDLQSAPGLGIQTTLVPAGGASAIDITFDAPGTYLLVDHAIARAIHKGTVGSIVVEGDPNTEVFEPGQAAPPAADPHAAEGTVVTMPVGAFDQRNAAKAFVPATATIKRGTSVTFKNDDQVAHTVTDDASAFDSGFIEPGASYSRTFDKAGTITFHCTPHPWMKGTVVVE